MSGRIYIEREASHAAVHGLGTLVIANPGKLNAIDLSMWRQMKSALDELAADPDLRCLRVTGALHLDQPPAFAAGGDLEEFLQARMTIDDAMAYHEGAVAPALAALADFPLPVVAQIDGPCIGGGLEIACCCDIRIAGDNASFGAPILKLGFNMYAGELAHVLPVAGRAVVYEMLLEGRIFAAPEALMKGVVGRVLPREQLESEVLAACRRIAQGAPLVAREHKKWIRRLSNGTPPNREEKVASLALVESADYREGLDAFFAKRRPEFKGA
jgi:enoyl-CoA hydratase/carnithine racemase